MKEPTAGETVSTDRVLEILQQEPIGAALLKAAIAQASAELFQTQLTEAQARIDELERQKSPALQPRHEG